MDLQTANRLIVSSQPARRLWQGSTAVLVGLSMLLGAFAAEPGILTRWGIWGWILPQVILVVIAALIVRHVVHERRAGQLMQEAHEAIQWQDWARAREKLEQLLGSPIRRSAIRAQSLLALTAVAEADRAYEASQRICEYLLEENLGTLIQQHVATVTLGAMMLRTGQLTDAVALIDRLVAQDLPAPFRARVELLALLREVILGHAHENLDRSSMRRDLFRAHLGTRAGDGYALLAAAFDRADQAHVARRYWHDATLLVPPAELLARFQELEPLAARYPCAEYPL